MKTNKTLKRLIAGLMAVAIVGGAVPGNIGTFDLFGDTAVKASAAEKVNTDCFARTSLNSLQSDMKSNFHYVSEEFAEAWIAENVNALMEESEAFGQELYIIFNYDSSEEAYMGFTPARREDGKFDLYLDVLKAKDLSELEKLMRQNPGLVYYAKGYPETPSTFPKTSAASIENDLANLKPLSHYLAQAWVDKNKAALEKEAEDAYAAAGGDESAKYPTYVIVVYKKENATNYFYLLYNPQTDKWISKSIDPDSLKTVAKYGSIIYYSGDPKPSVSSAAVTMKFNSAKIASVVYEGKQLAVKTDYTLAYTDSSGNPVTGLPSDPGNYRAVLTGINAFDGKLIVPFEIVASSDENISIIGGGEGTSTSNNENLLRIFDGNINTKWCGRTAGLGAYSNRDADWLLFEAKTPFVLHNYVLTTANDTFKFSGRNWKSWRIYGSNDSAAANYAVTYTDHRVTDIDENMWSLVHQVVDDTVLERDNYTDFRYSVPNNKNEYKYYLLVIDDIVDTNDNVQQMSEIAFNVKASGELLHIEPMPATCTGIGYYVECWYDRERGEYYADPDGYVMLDVNDVIIPTVGQHQFGEPEWTWDEQNLTATATFTCPCGEKMVLAAEVKSSGHGASCTSPSVSSHVASVVFEGVTYKSEPLIHYGESALGHSYGEPTWNWDDEKHTATATFKCERCSEEQTIEAIIDTNVMDPTYTAEGKIVYTAFAAIGGKTYTDTKKVKLEKLTYTAPKITFEKGDGKVKLTWTAVEGAEKYGIYGYKNGTWEPLTTCSGNSYVMSGLQADKDYKVFVATRLNGKWHNDTSNAIVVTPKSAAVKANPTVKAESGTNAVKLTWNAVSGAEKYAVVGYVNGTWKNLAEGKGTSYVLKDLKAGTKYKAAVSAMINGKWNTDFSNAIVVTCKDSTTSKYPVVTSQVSGSRFRIRWTAVKDAEAYGLAVLQSGKWSLKEVFKPNVSEYTSPKMNKGRYICILVAKVNGEWVIADANNRAFIITIR